MNTTMRAKTTSALRLRGVLILALCASALTARAAYDCDADYVNPWYDTNGLTGDLTNAVVNTTVCYNGHAGPYSLPGGSLLPPLPPADGTFQLNRSSVGEPFAEVVPDAAIGDVLVPPAGAITNQAPVIYPDNAAFFVLSTGQVIATSHGTVVLTWKMTGGGTSVMTYDVSGVATRRPEKIFWTEAPYYSPVVSLSGKFARIHYNDDVPPPVVTTNIVVLSETNSVTNIVTDCSATVWIDDSNGSKSLRAQGCNGLFVIELFDTGSFANQIGWEVVQVLAPDIIYQNAAIGQRLLPQDTYYGIGSLQAQITSGANATGDATLYRHSSSSGKSAMEGWLYSVYQTVYDPWDAEVYWMNTGVAGIQWPIEKDQYLADWPVDCQVMTYASGPTNSAPTLIPTALNPQLMPMEEPIRNFALNNGTLTVQTTGYGLLKYTSQDENVWFQAVQSVAHDNSLVYDLMPVPWDVGTRLQPAVAQSALALSELTAVDCGSGPTVLGRQPRTVELWANLHAGAGLPLFSMGATNPLAGFALRTVSIADNSLVLAMDVNGAATNAVLAGSPDQWHHYALTYDGLNLLLYFDGGNVAAMTVILETLPGPFSVGSASTTGNPNYDRADVMEVRVWAEARTSEQLLGRMNQNLSARDLMNANLLAYYPLNVSDGAATLDFASGYIAPITSPYGYVAATAPVTFGLDPWSHYPGFIYSGRSYNPDFYAYPMVTNNPNSGSAIFAVHTNSPLEIWWANRYQPAGLPAAIYWPSLVTRYQPQWPTNVPTLVLAHQTEADNALPDNADNASLYYQNDVTQVGFNPNEEHALIFGNSVYAIRNDLNNPSYADSSAPLVLVEYTDRDTGAASMLAFAVVATNSQYGFNYPVTVPELIEPMAPLGYLANPNCTNTVNSDGPAWVDRNFQWYAKRAGKDGTSTETVQMNWCYENQPGFYYPGESPQPALGQEIPFLSGHGSKGQPQPVTYTISWPLNCPKLWVGDTLVKPDQQQVGLPDISDQLSVDILFQQSLPYGATTNSSTTPTGVAVVQSVERPVNNDSRSVVLIDPTRYRSSTLRSNAFIFALPSAVQQQVVGGLTFFPDLPPQLNQRLWWQPTQAGSSLGQLRILGTNVVPAAGIPYLLLNLLGADEQAAAVALSPNDNWQTAVKGLPTNVVEITSGDQPFDSLALSAGIGRGQGYVTLAFNNGNKVPPGTPISLACFQVVPPLATGEVKAIPPADVLNEQMTMRHTTDCAGHPENYRFDWRYNPPDGPTNNPYSAWPAYPTGVGANQITFGKGQPLFTLSDNYFVCRYQSLDPLNPAGTNWSAWTQPMIAESWVKRAMNAINPYNQRVVNYQQQPPDYTINMIALAGEPYLGDVALISAHINDFGLIEIYWTIFNRALNMIAALPGGGDQAMNDTLRYAATRLNALYMLLGNEAYADALDPTIGFSAQSDWDGYGDILNRASSLFCFMNQVPTLLDEELCLLRGRDNKLTLGVKEAPIYNRLMWNFSKGIDGGELAYALNYGIADAQGNLSGTMSETDAKKLYPQGHGDAWGHYLSALTLYYKLLHTTNYVWIADSTAMDLGGVTVDVGYYDEEKFAETAAARVRTGQDIVRRTFQQTYQSAPSGLWSGYRDTDTNRCWGVGDWGVRAGQGAYFDWLTVNSLLPTHDTNPSHTGIQVIDRSTVRALGTLSAAGQSLQNVVDGADGDLNPLGLARNIMPFDISPAGIDAGQSHFEQIYDRALVALNNAQTALDQAQGASQRLRRQATSFNNYVTDTVAQNESNARSRLLEIFGTPYSDDIGPGQSYPDGYDGPDLYHFMCVDLSAIGGAASGFTNSVSIWLPAITNTLSFSPAASGNLGLGSNQVTFVLNNEGALGTPTNWTGIRSRPGEYQIAKQAYLQGMVELKESYIKIQLQVAGISSAVDSFNSYHTRLVGQFSYMMAQDALYLTSLTSKLLADAKAKKADFSQESHLLAGIMNQLAEPFVDGFVEGVIGGLADGDITGLTVDPGIAGRDAAMATTYDLTIADKAEASMWATVAKVADLAMTTSQQALNNWTWVGNNSDALQSRLSAIKAQTALLPPMIQEVQAKSLAVNQLAAKCQALGAEGTDLLGQLSGARAAGAWRVQNARYADMTLRIFRDESLRKYSDTFDLAAKYAYMAASAYDYETALLSGDPTAMAGSQFMDRILRTRSLGAVVNGQPLPANGYGDAGLADALARMKGDWSVLKGRLGFNNPDTETSRFSLRTELFRIAPGSASDATWQNQLQLCQVDLTTIPEYNNYCKALGTPSTTNEPGLMITFSTTIMPGQNFFGQDLAGGDNAYDPTHSATKIRSVGVWFASYTNAFGSGMANAPRVYLFPVGADLMRSPSRSSGEFIRSWSVFDQALPVPYNVSAADVNAPNWIPYFDSLSENFAAARRFASLRAYHDNGNFTPAELCTNARLIGRSVWNTKWMLLIPGRTLLADPVEGLNRFIYGPMKTGLMSSGRSMQGVTDIKLFFNTYSFSGD